MYADLLIVNSNQSLLPFSHSVTNKLLTVSYRESRESRLNIYRLNIYKVF